MTKSVSEKYQKVENAGEKTASSPQPSPPEEERERISQTRSKITIKITIKIRNRALGGHHASLVHLPRGLE